MRATSALLTFFVAFVGFSASAQPLKVWLFKTHLQGALNQRLAVAQRLTKNIEILTMPTRESSTTPEEFVEMTLGAKKSDPSKWPDFIFHTEDWKHEAEFLLGLRALAPKPLRVIYIEDPKNFREQMDLIAMDSRYPMQAGKNIMRTMGVASAITPDLLIKAKEYWKGQFSWMPGPRIFVALGGDSLNNSYKPEFAADLGERLRALIKTHGGSVILSTSRRTPDTEVVSEIVRHLSGIPVQILNWKKNGGDDEKFYAGALAWSTHVVATGDSMSMLSDAVMARKPLYIHAPVNSTLPEHGRLVEDLYVTGRARPLTGKELKTWDYEAIDVAGDIAAEVLLRFGCEGILK